MLKKISVFLFAVAAIGAILLCADVSRKSVVVSHLAHNQRITIVFVGMHTELQRTASRTASRTTPRRAASQPSQPGSVQILDGIVIASYTPSNAILTLIPLSPDQKLPDSKRKTLQNLFQSTSHTQWNEFKTSLETICGMQLPLYVVTNPRHFSAVQHVLADINTHTKYTPEYTDLFPGNNTEHAVGRQYAALCSMISSCMHARAVFYAVPFIRAVSNTRTNLTAIDCVALFTETIRYSTHQVVMIAPPYATQGYGDYAYINQYLVQPIGPDPYFRVEVLNASGKIGAALALTRFLRMHGIDVQNWDTSSVQEQHTMIIDRTGNWRNAQYVGRMLGYDTVFSKKDGARFVDVSVIVGKDAIPQAETLEHRL